MASCSSVVCQISFVFTPLDVSLFCGEGECEVKGTVVVLEDANTVSGVDTVDFDSIVVVLGLYSLVVL